MPRTLLLTTILCSLLQGAGCATPTEVEVDYTPITWPKYVAPKLQKIEGDKQTVRLEQGLPAPFFGYLNTPAAQGVFIADGDYAEALAKFYEGEMARQRKHGGMAHHDMFHDLARQKAEVDAELERKEEMLWWASSTAVVSTAVALALLFAR